MPGLLANVCFRTKAVVSLLEVISLPNNAGVLPFAELDMSVKDPDGEIERVLASIEPSLEWLT